MSVPAVMRTVLPVWTVKDSCVPPRVHLVDSSVAQQFGVITRHHERYTSSRTSEEIVPYPRADMFWAVCGTKFSRKRIKRGAVIMRPEELVTCDDCKSEIAARKLIQLVDPLEQR